VRSDGKVEDHGDFSDFYIPPAQHMTDEQRRQFQQLQDEVCQQTIVLEHTIHIVVYSCLSETCWTLVTVINLRSSEVARQSIVCDGVCVYMHVCVSGQ